MCGVASILYWTFQSEPLRKIDKVAATGSFAIYTLYAAIKISAVRTMALWGWSLWGCVGSLYLISVKLHSVGLAVWKPVHTLFHCLVAIGQALVVI